MVSLNEGRKDKGFDLSSKGNSKKGIDGLNSPEKRRFCRSASQIAVRATTSPIYPATKRSVSRPENYSTMSINASAFTLILQIYAQVE